MELALINYTLEKSLNAGWKFVIPPSIVRSEVVSACGFQPRDDFNNTQIYFLQGSDIKSTHCLAGTSEILIAGMEINKTLRGSDVPKKIVGISRSYRSEAGARGKKSKGLYRVHEFTKAELFAWTDPKESNKMLDDILDLQENIIKELGLYARILDMPTFELAQNIIIHLLSSLETTSQTIINQLQEVTDTIIQQSPQLNYDVNLLYNNIMILSELLNEKKKEIGELKRETEDYTNDNFIRLEIMKQRLQATCSVLEKAKNWKDTETEKKRIELLIENKSLEEAKKAINELKCLVEVWKETNEYNKRLNIVKNLEDKILNF
ncbi:hypothetical protein PCK2_000801 [Pneumocystis canis]|nr:hypothetical protein PCK2_000801 [Pneumocystis canis]